MTELQTPQITELGPVDVCVPAEPAMSRVLRLAASAVASLARFDVAEIEDIKLAVSEVLIALVEHGAGEHVDVRFTVAEDEFTILAVTAVETWMENDHADLNLWRVVLADVCTEYHLELEGGEARISATLRRPFTGT